MSLARAALVLGLAAATAIAPPSFAAPAVVADMAAIHSIVARVMEGVGEPDLLLPPGASPHEYALRPSEAAALEAAALVFWVGDAYTPWLADPIATLAPDARRIALQDAAGLDLLPLRAGGPFDHPPHVHHQPDAHAGAHADREHEEYGHWEPGHEDQDHGDHEHGEHGHRDHASGEHEPVEHDHTGHAQADGGSTAGSIDGHLWLDPLNAAAIAAAAADALAEADPENAGRYRANADAFAAEMAALVAEVEHRLAPAARRRFVVFHDAYQYFESRFVLPASGSIALHDADQPSPARMADIRERIRAERVACVFSEPQFPASLVETAIEGTGAEHGTLDPIGADLEPGPSFYPNLIHGLADDLLACLAPGE